MKLTDLLIFGSHVNENNRFSAKIGPDTSTALCLNNGTCLSNLKREEAAYELIFCKR